MIVLPGDNAPFRIVGIDPGTDTLGTAVLDVDLRTGQTHLIFAQTFVGAKLSSGLHSLMETHGDRWAKQQAHSNNLLGLFQHFLPHVVICESPFLGKFPQAFEALVECKAAIRKALLQYDPTLPLELVDPPSVKSAVGAPTKRPKEMSKDDFKKTVNQALVKLPIVNHTSQSLERFDEHSTDAIAVAYYKSCQVRAFLGGC